MFGFCDVFSGQRSSSLHYAACFGRPAIARVLLRHGANPDLRDEDGKTPLDKARERLDEGRKYTYKYSFIKSDIFLNLKKKTLSQI